MLTVTARQAARLLGMGETVFYREAEHLGALRIGRRLVVPVSRIAQMLGVTADDVRRAAATLGRDGRPLEGASSLAG